MVKIKVDKNNDIRLIVNLESNSYIPGVYANPSYDFTDDKILSLENLLNKVDDVDISNNNFITNKKIISTYEDVIDHFKPAENKYFVKGLTSVKSNTLLNYISKINFNNLLQGNSDINHVFLSGDSNNGISEVNVENSNFNFLNVKFEILGANVSAMILSGSFVGDLEYVLFLDTDSPIKYKDITNTVCEFTYLRSHEEKISSANLLLYEDILEEPEVDSEVFIERGINSAFENIIRLNNVNNIDELYKHGLGYYKINKNGFNFKKEEI
jgi:hypothetical protein